MARPPGIVFEGVAGSEEGPVIRRLVRGFLAPRALAHAHSGKNSYLMVFLDHGSVHGTIQFLARDLNSVLGLDLPTDGSDPAEAIVTHLDAIRDYALAHTQLGAPPWTIQFTGERALQDHGAYVILHYEVVSPPSPLPHRLEVTFDPIMEHDAHHEAVVTFHRQRGLGPLKIRSTERHRANADSPLVSTTIPPDRIASDLVAAAKAIVSRVVRLSRRLRPSRGSSHSH